jgi:hypothetical protein
MTTVSNPSRRAFFKSVITPALAAAAIATVAIPSGAHAQAQAPQLVPGNYQGYWHDGRSMVERVTVTPSEITLHRIAGGDVQGQTFRYIRSGASTYNSPNGHVIMITSATTFTWTNSNGQNGVAYSLLR